MSVDNFELLKPFLTFESDDDFYFCQVLQRKKENSHLGRNSHVVKTYYIKSVEDLDRDRGEMICLANFHNARVCLNLNKRSFERTCLHTLKKITDQIMNKDYRQARKAYTSVCGTYCQESDKKWIIDIDDKHFDFSALISFLYDFRPVGRKYLLRVETKNGYHIITSPFDLQEFRKLYPDLEVHKNNPTILYIP